MPEKKELIKTIHTKMMCGCGGEMKFLVRGIPRGNENRYIHKCTKCGTLEHYNKRYPRTEPLEE